MRALCFAAAMLAALPLARAGDDAVPFTELGKAFLKSHFKTDDAAAVPFQTVHDKACVHGTFGVFEIAYPTWEIREKGHPEDLRSIALVLLQAQVHWMDWLAKDWPETKAPKADAEILTAWVKTWKPAGFSKAASAPDKNLYVLLGANDAQRAAAKRLTEFMLQTEVLGVAPSTGEPVHILFAPTRLDFVQLLGYAGLLDPDQQASLWTYVATTWTGFWLDWTLVLALEYPPWNEDKKFESGLSMNKFEPTGMLEHTLQQAMLAFLWTVYGDNDALYLNQAQAMNMVVEVVGTINALEGEGGRGTTGGQTAPYSKFVPGGNSSGGTLPPMPAGGKDAIKRNPWHEGLGKDHFVAALRKGQKAGYKHLQHESPTGLDPAVYREKNSHFALTSDNASKHVVSAPFMGEPAKANTYPPLEFIGDYREFFRAYKCAFYWWVQTHGDKSGAEASATKYAELMRLLFTRAPGRTLDEVVESIYGVPLSGSGMDVDSLEWRFLDWLAKSR